MKVSDAISQLHTILHDCGDIDVISLTPTTDGESFFIEIDRVFEVVKPDGFSNFMAAYMDPIPQEPRPELTLVKTDG